MDCKTARMLLDFARPHCAELDPAEARSLQEHLAHCPECDALAQAERAADEHIGEAVRQVDVPPGLRGRLLARLQTEAAAADRQPAARGWAGWVRAAAVAAAVLVAVSAWLFWQDARAVSINLPAFCDKLQEQEISPPGPAEINGWFTEMGVVTSAPDDVSPHGLNYKYFTYYGLTEFQGKRVPQMIFVRNDHIRARAQVLILSGREFDLKHLPPEEDRSGYQSKVELRRVKPGYAYLIVYTGEDMRWLEADDHQAE
jgi:hypothetical protein